VFEHADTLPAASAAVADQVVDVFAVTVDAMDHEAVAFANVCAAVPLQVPFLYKRIVTPVSAVVPRMVGVVFVLDGEVGVVPVRTGAAGTLSSWV
jgi:hypothetical protein